MQGQGVEKLMEKRLLSDLVACGGWRVLAADVLRAGLWGAEPLVDGSAGERRR